MSSHRLLCQLRSRLWSRCTANYAWIDLSQSAMVLEFCAVHFINIFRCPAKFPQSCCSNRLHLDIFLLVVLHKFSRLIIPLWCMILPTCCNERINSRTYFVLKDPQHPPTPPHHKTENSRHFSNTLNTPKTHTPITTRLDNYNQSKTWNITRLEDPWYGQVPIRYEIKSFSFHGFGHKTSKQHQHRKQTLLIIKIISL